MVKVKAARVLIKAAAEVVWQEIDRGSEQRDLGDRISREVLGSPVWSVDRLRYDALRPMMDRCPAR